MVKAEASVEELVGMIERGELQLQKIQRQYREVKQHVFFMTADRAQYIDKLVSKVLSSNNL